MAKQKVPISRRALIARINRKLANDGWETLKIARGWNAIHNLGEMYLLDVHRNAVTQTNVDLEDFAKEHGVLQDWEQLEDGQ
jgi:hypothetical protein